MSSSIDTHQIGIICRNCETRWKLTIPLTGNKVEVFATICPCSAIIVGNYNSVIIEKVLEGSITIKNDAISKDETYLTNGHFDILEIEGDEITKLPELALE